MASKLIQKCGVCGRQWYKGRNVSTRIESGPPVVRCSSCGALNRTALKWYSELQMKTKLKIFILSRMHIIMWIWIAFFVSLKWFFTGSLEDFEWDAWKLPAFLLFVSSSLTLRSWIKMNDFMKNLEKCYLEQYGKASIISSSEFIELYLEA